MNLTTSPLYPQNFKHRIGISKISFEWTNEWKILPEFSQLIHCWNRPLEPQNPIGRFLFEAPIPPVSERAGGWWQWTETLPRNCPQQPHPWPHPLPRTSLHPRTSGWEHTNYQPLVPQFGETQKGHPSSRAPHWEPRPLWCGFVSNFSLCPVLFLSLSGISPKGISPPIQFSVFRTPPRSVFPGESNLRLTDHGKRWGQHWWWALQIRSKSSYQGAALDYFWIPGGSVLPPLELPRPPGSEPLFLQRKWPCLGGLRRSPCKFRGSVNDFNARDKRDF